MITVNGHDVNIDSFPDGTILMKQGLVFAPGVIIAWKYENDREFLALIYLVKHLRRLGYQTIDLVMPYIPNARMDRVKNVDDVFTLKYFCELLNDLELSSVTVLDPHSNVSEALIDNIIVKNPKKQIETVYNKLTADGLNDILLFYPDEGACKRLSTLIKAPYAFGIKKRDWATGQILGLDVAGDIGYIAGRDILIVDDICSRGGTFLHAAKKLKELGARNIYLYVSHCENTILEGELLTSGLIERVFTTDSIFTASHRKVEVLK